MQESSKKSVLRVVRPRPVGRVKPKRGSDACSFPPHPLLSLAETSPSLASNQVAQSDSLEEAENSE